MRHKQIKFILAGIVGLVLAVLIAICLVIFFPQVFSLLFQSSWILALILLSLTLTPRFARPIHFTEQPKKSLLQACALIIGLQGLTFLCLFTTLTALIRVLSVTPVANTTPLLPTLIAQQDWQLGHLHYFFWGYIAFFAVCAGFLYTRYPDKLAPLYISRYWRGPALKVFMGGLYNLFRLGLMWGATLILTLFVLNLISWQFPLYPLLANGYLCAIIVILLIFLVCNHRANHFFDRLKKQTRPIFLNTAALLVTLYLLLLLAALINTQWHTAILKLSKPISLHASWLPIPLSTFIHLISISLWLAFTPLLGSLSLVIFNHHRYRYMVWALLFPSLFISASFPYWGPSLLTYLFYHDLSLIGLQAVITVLLLITAGHKKAAQTCWQGFITPRRLKHRLQFNGFWLLAILLLGALSLNGHNVLSGVLLSSLNLWLLIVLLIMGRALFKHRQ